MSYARMVKFDYCRLYYKVEKSNNAYQLFDIETFIQKIQIQNLELKIIDVYDGCKVRIEQFDYNMEKEVWSMRILRLRDANLSFIVKPDEEAKPIELGDDEYLGEDMTMLFDAKANIAMIQINRFAIGFTNLQKLIQKILDIEGLTIEIRPITKELDAQLIQRDYFKSIEIRFANLKGKDVDSIGGSLGSIMRTYREFNGGGGSFVVNLGRTRKNSLSKEKVRGFLSEIQQNKDVLSAAVLRAKNAEDTDIAIYNLFDNIFSALITFELAERTSLDYKYCVRKMIEKYIIDRNSILALV